MITLIGFNFVWTVIIHMVSISLTLKAFIKLSQKNHFIYGSTNIFILLPLHNLLNHYQSLWIRGFLHHKFYYLIKLAVLFVRNVQNLAGNAAYQKITQDGKTHRSSWNVTLTVILPVIPLLTTSSSSFY